MSIAIALGVKLPLLRLYESVGSEKIGFGQRQQDWLQSSLLNYSDSTTTTTTSTTTHHMKDDKDNSSSSTGVAAAAAAAAAAVEGEAAFEIQFTKVSLKCPITMTLLKDPGRSQNCVHLEAFDIMKYILKQKKKNYSSFLPSFLRINY